MNITLTPCKCTHQVNTEGASHNLDKAMFALVKVGEFGIFNKKDYESLAFSGVDLVK